MAQPPTMPPNFSSSYARYKKETDSFVTWLVKTSVECGFELPIRGSGMQQVQPSKRLKGKARKKAREETGTNSGDIIRATELSPRVLLRCAEAIAKVKKAAFRIPFVLSNALKEAIGLRTKCSVWLEKQQQVENSESLRRSIDSHRFFNGVLCKIEGILQPFIEPTAMPSTATHNPSELSKGICNTTNMFARLNVEETDADDNVMSALNVPEARVSEGPTTFNKVSESPLPSLYEAARDQDALMAVYCLFEDFLEIRVATWMIWHSYQDQQGSDYLSAAVMTQAANEYIATLAKNFEETFPHIASMKEVLVLLLRSIDQAPGSRTEEAEDPGADPRSYSDNRLIQEMAARSYIETFDSINQAAKRDYDYTKCEIVCSRDMDEDFWEKLRKGREMWSPSYALSQYLSFILALRRSRPDVSHVDDLLPDADSFTRLWWSSTGPGAKDLKPGVEQVLVTQLMLDIFTCLGQKGTDRYNEDNMTMFEILLKAEMSWLDMMCEPRPKDPENPSICAQPHLKGQRSLDADQALVPLNMMISGNPIFAGLRFFYRFVGFKLDYLNAANVQSDIASVAHLVNMCQQLEMPREEKPVFNGEWEDLDTALAIIGHPKIFFSAKYYPVTIRECANKVRLSLGLPLRTLASDHRTNQSFRNTKPRGFKLNVPMLQAIQDNYEHLRRSDGSRIQVHAPNIREALLDFTLNVTSGSNTLQEATTALDTGGFELLLLQIRMAVQLQLGVLVFDYTGMAVKCRQILHDCYHALKSHLMTSLNFKGLPEGREHHTPLLIMIEEEKAARITGRSIDSNVLSTSILPVIARTLSRSLPKKKDEQTQIMWDWLGTLRIIPPRTIRPPSSDMVRIESKRPPNRDEVVRRLAGNSVAFDPENHWNGNVDMPEGETGLKSMSVWEFANMSGDEREWDASSGYL